MNFAWFGFRILTALTALAWIGTFALDPDIANPALAFSLFWVVGLPVLVYGETHGWRDEEEAS